MSRKRRPGGRDPRAAGVDPQTAAVRRWLTDSLRAAAGRQLGRTPVEHVYGSPEEFVLRHGTWHTPGRVTPMVMKHCFANALNCALVYPGWTYVEGYALEPLTRMPIHHAWGLDERGRAIELTWRVPGLAYLGVPFAVERADDCSWVGDATVLDDYRRAWPLLRERWQGEPGDVPRSDRLRALAVTLPFSPLFAEAGLPAPPQPLLAGDALGAFRGRSGRLRPGSRRSRGWARMRRWLCWWRRWRVRCSAP